MFQQILRYLLYRRRFGRGRHFTDTCGNKLFQQKVQGFFLSQVLLLLHDHLMQLAQQRSRSLVPAQNRAGKQRQFTAARQFQHGLAHDLRLDVQAAQIQQVIIHRFAVVRGAGIEQQHITGSDIIIHIVITHMAQAAFLHQPDHVIFVEMLRKSLQYPLKPIGFQPQFLIVFYKAFFVFHSRLL